MASDEQPLTFATDADNDVPPKFSGLRQTAAYFQFQNVQELQNFWASNLWKPYANMILDNVINPERQQAIADGTTRTRSVNFATVAAFLEEGQSSGRAMYSNPFADTTQYRAVDHYCAAMYRIRLYNSETFGGLFFGNPNMRPHRKLCLIWAMLQTWFYENTPSRVKKREEAAKKRSAKELALAAKRAKTGHERSSSTSTEAEPTTNPEETDDDEASRRNLAASNQPAPGNHDTDPALEETEIAFPTDMFATVNEAEQAIYQARVRNSTNAEALSAAVTNQEPQLLTPLQKMYIQRVHGNLNDRAFKYDLCMAVRKGWTDPRQIEEQVYLLANQNRALDDQAWRRQIERIAEDTEAPEGDPVLPFDLANDDEKETFIHNQTLVDDSASQPQGHVFACERMGLEQPGYPRYASMTPQKTFMFWQVLGFDWIHKKKESGLSGVLLCDSMGLGKTWEIVGFMLSSLYLRRTAIESGEVVEPARPFLVVVPPGILPNQWMNQITDITTGLTVIKYWGELSDSLNSSRKQVLSKDDELFNGAEKNSRAVIVTTYHTWRARHGPSAQEAFHLKKLKWSAERATREFHILDSSWPHNLSGQFSDVIADEATYVKSIKAQSHVALKWLKAFTILVTATPDVNSVADFEGYMNFIQPSARIMNEQVYDVLTVLPTMNPYVTLEQNENLGTLLRCSLNQFRKWILDESSPVVQGKLLAVLYGDCMVRRSHVSVVDGKMIGNDIPALKHRMAECFWYKDIDTQIDEEKAYKAHAKQHVRALVRVDEHGNVTWNWRHYRILILLSTWVGFAHIEEAMQADAIPDLMKKGPGPKLLEWIVSEYCDATGEAFPDDLAGCLAMICHGAPKIRALLHLIAHVVVLLEKKVLIFCTMPAQQILLYGILSALQIPTSVYYADLEKADKVALQTTFNISETPQVLIGSFATTSVGINLQSRCHWVVFLDPPPSVAIGEQAAGRCHRVGQTNTVEVVTFVTSRSFNDRQVRNNMKKAIPGVIAALNKEAFMGAKLQYDRKGEARLQMGDWVEYKGRLIRSDDTRLPANHGLALLRGNQVVARIIEMKMGTRVGWEVEDDETVDEE